jgi:hypothetical protein
MGALFGRLKLHDKLDRSIMLFHALAGGEAEIGLEQANIDAIGDGAGNGVFRGLFFQARFARLHEGDFDLGRPGVKKRGGEHFFPKSAFRNPKFI